MRNEFNRPNVDRPSDGSERRAGFGSMGMMVAVAMAIAIGLVLWGMSSSSHRVADTSAPATTTGSSTSAPTPSNPPAVKSPAGQGESNSTR